MKGVVEVYRGEEKILEESNMLMDNLGSQIAFWMSLPRGFESIESASTIYDTSNYTVRAASLGKDAAGYNYHAHSPLVAGDIAKDGIFRVLSFEGDQSFSYRTEKFATYYNDSSGVSAIVPRESERLGDNIVDKLLYIGPNWVNIGNTGISFSALSVSSTVNPFHILSFYAPVETGKIYRVGLRLSNYVSGTVSVGLNSSYSPYKGTGNGLIFWNLAAGPPNGLSLQIRGSGLKAVVSEITVQRIFVDKVKVLPEFSHPKQQRLESQSTRVKSIVKSDYDYGHNVNVAISGIPFRPVGCYCPDGPVRFRILKGLPDIPSNRKKDVPITNNVGFNSYAPPAGEGKSIDSRGFIRVTAKTLGEANTDYANNRWKNGLNVSTQNAQLFDNYTVSHTIGITRPDFICLNFFGGIYTVGLWGYDIEKMLSKGMTPPFTKYNIEEIDYKLFARKTFNKDLTYYEGTSNNPTDFNEVKTLKLIWRFNFV